MSAESLETTLLRALDGLPGATADQTVQKAAQELAHEQRLPIVQALKAELEKRVRLSPPTASALGEALVPLAGDVPEALAQALRGRATTRHFNGDNQGALTDFLAAIELHKQLSQELEAAIAHRSLVEVCHQLGQTEAALEHAELAREALNHLSEFQLLAELEVNVGNVFVRLDEYPRAGEAYRRARGLFQRLGHELGQAFVDFNLAVVEMNACRIDEARDAWLRARDGLDSAGFGMHVADCDYNLAYLQSRAGEYREAVEGLESARQLYRENGKPSGEPLCDLDLAEIHLRLGSADLGLEHAQIASKRFEELDLKDERARADTWVGLAHEALGESNLAREAFSRACATFEELGNEVAVLRSRLQWAELDIKDGRIAEAERLLIQAREAFEQRSLPWPAAVSSMMLARCRLEAGAPEEALALLQGLEQEESEQGGTGVHVGELVALERLCLTARAHDQMGEREQAIDRLRIAIDRLDVAYVNLPNQRTSLDFLREQHQAFLDLAFLLAVGSSRGEASQSHADLAAAVEALEEGRLHSQAERELERTNDSPELSRARAQLELLLARRLDEELGLPPDTNSEENPRVRGAAPSESVLHEAQRRLQELEGHGQNTSVPDRSRVSFDELREALHEDEAALIYAVSSRGTLGIRLERDDLIAVPLQASPDWLGTALDRLSFHLDRLRLGASWQRDRLPQMLSGVNRLLEEFGNRLIAPLLQGCTKRSLVVVPYGPLHDLPFHATRPGGRTLIEDHDLSYAFGLADLRSARERGRTTAKPSGQLHLLDAGSTLEHAGSELDAIAQLYEGNTNEVSLADVRSGALAGLRGGLHVAGHGLFRPEHPEFSALSDGQAFLFARDVSALELDLDLVVLSGCETGRPARLRAEELVGLPRSFRSAGARTVVASAWPVEDAAAQRFQVCFWRDLARGKTAREAQSGAWRLLAGLEGLNSETNSDFPPESVLPSAWAAFSLFGDPDVRFPCPTKGLRSV